MYHFQQRFAAVHAQVFPVLSLLSEVLNCRFYFGHSFVGGLKGASVRIHSGRLFPSPGN
jgi:hypothetical protein